MAIMNYPTKEEARRRAVSYFDDPLVAWRWLDSPNKAFNMKSPEQKLEETDGPQAVITLLDHMAQDKLV